MPVIDGSDPDLHDLRRIDEWLTRNASPDVLIRMLMTIRERAGFLGRVLHGGRPQADETRLLRVCDAHSLILHRLAGDVVRALRLHHQRKDWSLLS